MNIGIAEKRASIQTWVSEAYVTGMSATIVHPACEADSGAPPLAFGRHLMLKFHGSIASSISLPRVRPISASWLTACRPACHAAGSAGRFLQQDHKKSLQFLFNPTSIFLQSLLKRPSLEPKQEITGDNTPAVEQDTRAAPAISISRSAAARKYFSPARSGSTATGRSRKTNEQHKIFSNPIAELHAGNSSPLLKRILVPVLHSD